MDSGSRTQFVSLDIKLLNPLSQIAWPYIQNILNLRVRSFFNFNNKNQTNFYKYMDIYIMQLDVYIYI